MTFALAAETTELSLGAGRPAADEDGSLLVMRGAVDADADVGVGGCVLLLLGGEMDAGKWSSAGSSCLYGQLSPRGHEPLANAEHSCCDRSRL